LPNHPKSDEATESVPGSRPNLRYDNNLPYYCTQSPTLLNPSANAQKSDILPGCSLRQDQKGDCRSEYDGDSRKKKGGERDE
jgi:hypothetical protein